MSSAGVFIQLLGPFQVLALGQPVSLRPGGKAEKLLACLALQPRVGVSRDWLLEHIWPNSATTLAGPCLNTLMHSLKDHLTDALAGQPPILHMHGRYALNLTGGVGVDLLDFQSAVSAGDRLLAAGSTAAAIESYEQAVSLYRGELSAGSDISDLLERERLRSICLTALARLADAHFDLGNHTQAMNVVARILAIDPCREDAHRMAMRLNVRLGARSQALRQYELCRMILQQELDAVPEPATTRLAELIRSDPGQV
ncbi:AfsR/SARP family transcriptional regulator [Mycobacterium sp. smrl_JER01]|uniref:AfsR/SARP family transcriptional regulator n=1 Tax=Mycobacterium sp. smrl_JER01 TaxID=3402633 RepID=UPI003AD27BF3